MTNSYIDKESGYPHIDPFQQIFDKLNIISLKLDGTIDSEGIRERMSDQLNQMLPLAEFFKSVFDKLDALGRELDELKVLMHIKEKTSGCAFCADETPTRSRSELIGDLDYMILALQTISSQAKQAPVTHADHLSLMMLISSLFKAS